MDNEEIKQKLLQIENTDLEFTVTMTGKESTRVNGLYKPETHEILLHNKNFKSDMQLIYTAIHEYTHHLLTEEFLAETGGKLPMKGSKVHTAAFWAKFHMLLQKAEELGIHTIWIRGFDSKTVADVYDLPEYMIPVMMLGLGYPNEKAKANPWHYRRNPIEDFVTEL